MPVATQKTIEFRELRKNDLLTWKGSEYKVVSKDIKTKYTYVEVEDETGRQVFKKESDEEITITREEMTEDEKLAMYRDYATQALTKMVETATTRYEKSRASLVEHLQGGYRLSERTWTEIAGVIEAEYAYEKMLDVHNISQAEDKDIVDGAFRAIAKITDELLENRWRGGSTAGFSRAEDESRREAASSLLRELKMNTYGLSK